MNQALNRAYRDCLAAGAYMIGEDILDPYGGAFKVTKGLSTEFPQRVLGTPISEAGIAGVGIGLSLMGSPAYVEIMFGDFITNVFDQLVSNAAKFFHMYAFQATVPVRIRTPMGGKRGYGPTHSQSLEKHFVGIDNLAVFSLTSLEDPMKALRAISTLPMPAVIIENKVDYGRFLWQGDSDHQITKQGGDLGALIVSPLRRSRPSRWSLTAKTRRDCQSTPNDFRRDGSRRGAGCSRCLHPLDLRPILKSARQTRRVLLVEDGSIAFGIGAEIVAQLLQSEPGLCCERIGAEPVPVPWILALERDLLPSVRELMVTLTNRPVVAKA